MGFILPAILPRAYTHILGGLLFLYFGYKLLKDSQALQEYKVSDELEEVEEELLHTGGKRDEDTMGELDQVQDIQLTEERGNYHGDDHIFMWLIFTFECQTTMA